MHQRVERDDQIKMVQWKKNDGDIGLDWMERTIYDVRHLNNWAHIEAEVTAYNNNNINTERAMRGDSRSLWAGSMRGHVPNRAHKWGHKWLCVCLCVCVYVYLLSAYCIDSFHFRNMGTLFITLDRCWPFLHTIHWFVCRTLSRNA